MRAIKCEICGGTDIIKQDGLFVCQYCGAKYSPEEVRKLAGTVRIDRTGETENCMTLARRFLHENNYPKAEEYFELVLRNDPNNLENCSRTWPWSELSSEVVSAWSYYLAQ